ncbi:hypothetical protein CQW23_23830 [Capsicum baccatum]|uniref:Uncharacterized protein n=1 Tax=Capsicum baccatum TaxID=33114 RepID=A0A2G2VT14_CAPBA|nr:hypothetical protein CQW23_23830 [Capsicum baccatum]
MMDEYRVYNGIKKWLDRNCDLVLDCPVRRRDLKNILKAHFKIYMAWKDDMVVLNVPNSDSNTDSIIVRNMREVRSRGRTRINRNRSSHQYVCRGDTRRWGFRYYDVYKEGQSIQGRSGGKRLGYRGSKGGGVCGSRGGRDDDANSNNVNRGGFRRGSGYGEGPICRNDGVNHVNSKKKFIVVAAVEDMKLTEKSSDGVQYDTKQVFKAMVELDEQMRRLQDRLDFMMIRINATEERILGDVVSCKVFLVELEGVLSIVVVVEDRSARNGQEVLEKLRNEVSQID